MVHEDFDGLLRAKDAEILFWMPDETVKALLSRPPTVLGSRPAHGRRLQGREALVDMPALEPGFYRVLAGHDESFGVRKNKIQVASLWVSDLGLVIGRARRRNRRDRRPGGRGRPGAGRAASLYQWNYSTSQLLQAGTAVSDETGAFALPAPDRYGNRLLVVRDPEGRLVAETRIESSPARRIDAYQQTVFFTDRSIYRPGQTISFKGLCLESRPAGQRLPAPAETGRAGRFPGREPPGDRRPDPDHATTSARSAGRSPRRPTA